MYCKHIFKFGLRCGFICGRHNCHKHNFIEPYLSEFIDFLEEYCNIDYKLVPDINDLHQFSYKKFMKFMDKQDISSITKLNNSITTYLVGGNNLRKKHKKLKKYELQNNLFVYSYYN